MRVSQNFGYLFGGPYNKDYTILGSILGSPYFGKLPYANMSQSLNSLQAGLHRDYIGDDKGLLNPKP